MIALAVGVTVFFAILWSQYLRLHYARNNRAFRENVVAYLSGNLTPSLETIKILTIQQANPMLLPRKQQSLNKKLQEQTGNALLVIQTFLRTHDSNQYTLQNLINNLTDFCKQSINQIIPVVLTLKVEQHKLKSGIEPPYANQVLLTFQELLLNMVKHTESAQILIQIQLANNQLDIRVQNEFVLVPPTKLPPLPSDPGIQEIFGIQKRSGEFLALGGDLHFSENLDGQICQMNIPLR